MRRKERVHEGLEVRTPPLRKSIANFPVGVNTFPGELRAHGRKALIQSLLESLDFIVVVVQVIAWPKDCQQWILVMCTQITVETYSLKKALAICSISTWGWLCSWQTRIPSQVRRIP
jgi:hypothetical protein